MSYCPKCGKYQGHIHLGWLKIGFRRYHTSPIDCEGVLHTQIICEKCGVTSIVVKMFGKDKSFIKEIVNAIREIFDFEGSSSSACSSMVC